MRRFIVGLLKIVHLVLMSFAGSRPFRGIFSVTTECLFGAAETTLVKDLNGARARGITVRSRRAAMNQCTPTANSI